MNNDRWKDMEARLDKLRAEPIPEVPDGITMRDGTIFQWKAPLWKHAFAIKLNHEPEQIQKGIEEFIEAVDEHWRNKTVMTKFGKVSWDQEGQEYGSHAALGDDVMYVFIRASLMGIILGAAGSKVITPNEEKGGWTVWDHTGKRRAPDLDDV